MNIEEWYDKMINARDRHEPDFDVAMALNIDELEDLIKAIEELS